MPKQGTSVSSDAAAAGEREGCLGNLCCLPAAEGIQGTQALSSMAGDRLWGAQSHPQHSAHQPFLPLSFQYPKELKQWFGYLTRFILQEAV